MTAAGDPLRIPARTWDEILSTIAWVKGQRDRTGVGMGGGGRGLVAGSILWIRNDSGADVSAYSILGITGVVYSPADNLLSFKGEPTLKGTTPAWPAHDGNFVVLLEPALAGGLARAIASGFIAAQVSVAAGDEWLGYADVLNGDASKLLLLPSGAAKILYRESGTGTKWAVVELGSGPCNVAKWGVLDYVLTAGGSVIVSIWDGDPLADTGNNVTAYDRLLTAGESIAAGSSVLVEWFPGSRKWYVIAAGCPPIV
jgi:hypothetical protein